MKEEFYLASLMEQKYLDRWLYRGKGRPRKSDYSTVAVLQRKVNQEYMDLITSQMFPKKEVQSE